jgi:hypothetical protein
MPEPLASWAGLVMLVLGGLAYGVLRVVRWRRPDLRLRPLHAYDSLDKQFAQVVETGGRLHVSLGAGSITGPETAVSLAGLSILEAVAADATVADQPPVVTLGDATLLLPAADVIRRAHEQLGALGTYDPLAARLVGLDAATLAAGAMPLIRGELIRGSLLIGSFGPEVALMAEAGYRQRLPQTVGSDRLEGQAVGLAMADHVLIGEEVFAARAYLTEDGQPARGSLAAQRGLMVEDLLRWVVVAALIAGAALQTLGMLR